MQKNNTQKNHNIPYVLTTLTAVSIAVLMALTSTSMSHAFNKDKPIDGQMQIDGQPLRNKQRLGEMLFFDTRLSKNQTMSCATCHNPDLAFTDGRQTAAKGMVSLGDDGHSFGNRNTPTASYAHLSPNFYFDDINQAYVGGQFWDGRADNLTVQAGQPPLNPVEMGTDKSTIIQRLKQDAHYLHAFANIYGKDIWQDTDKAYDAMTDAIASFETTPLFSPFDSKYDRYLQGEYELTPLEDLGRTLFFSNDNVNCHRCHKLPQSKEDDQYETFTNYQYHNIGVPSNKQMLALTKVATDFVDLGLMNHPKLTHDTNQKGKFKTPTLRNVAVTAPYMHNGVFKDLKTVVLFYDKYNNPDNCINPETNKPWNDAEVTQNISLEELKAQKLTDRKVEALVAFMETLTDKRYEHLLKK